MNTRSLFLAGCALLALYAPALAEPKAYDVVKYRGKAGALAIAFDFADGYGEASELRITDNSRKPATTTVFALDQSGEMRFVPRKKDSSDRSATLEMSPDDAAPATVNGSYTANGNTVSFKLTRQ